MVMLRAMEVLKLGPFFKNPVPVPPNRNRPVSRAKITNFCCSVSVDLFCRNTRFEGRNSQTFYVADVPHRCLSRPLLRDIAWSLPRLCAGLALVSASFTEDSEHLRTPDEAVERVQAETREGSFFRVFLYKLLFFLRLVLRRVRRFLEAILDCLERAFGLYRNRGTRLVELLVKLDEPELPEDINAELIHFLVDQINRLEGESSDYTLGKFTYFGPCELEDLFKSIPSSAGRLSEIQRAKLMLRARGLHLRNKDLFRLFGGDVSFLAVSNDTGAVVEISSYLHLVDGKLYHNGIKIRKLSNSLMDINEPIDRLTFDAPHLDKAYLLDPEKRVRYFVPASSNCINAICRCALRRLVSKDDWVDIAGVSFDNIDWELTSDLTRPDWYVYTLRGSNQQGIEVVVPKNFENSFRVNLALYDRASPENLYDVRSTFTLLELQAACTLSSLQNTDPMRKKIGSDFVIKQVCAIQAKSLSPEFKERILILRLPMEGCRGEGIAHIYYTYEIPLKVWKVELEIDNERFLVFRNPDPKFENLKITYDRKKDILYSRGPFQ